MTARPSNAFTRTIAKVPSRRLNAALSMRQSPNAEFEAFDIVHNALMKLWLNGLGRRQYDPTLPLWNYFHQIIRNEANRKKKETPACQVPDNLPGPDDVEGRIKAPIGLTSSKP